MAAADARFASFWLSYADEILKNGGNSRVSAQFREAGM